jgi:Trk K+ transport system NAD-binding subunit
MINRNEEIIAPRGSTEIEPGDVLYVLTRTDDRDAVARAIARALAQA